VQKKETRMQNFQRAIEVAWIDTAGDPNGKKRNSSEVTDFLEAVRTNDLEKANELLTRGNESKETLLTAKDEDGKNALMHAAYQGNTNAIEAFLAVEDAKLKRAQLTAKDTEGQNALMHAALEDNAEAIEALLSVEDAKLISEQLTATDKDDRNALMHAVRSTRGSAVNELLSVSDELISAQITATDKDGRNALITAANYGNVDAIKALLSVEDAKLKRTQLTEVDEGGKNALMFAVMYGKVDAIKALLSVEDDELKREQLTAKDIYGWNALMHSTIMRNVYVVKALLSVEDDELKRPQLTAQDTEGQNALMHATIMKNVYVVKALLSVEDDELKRPQLTAVDNNGQNALMHAVRSTGGAAVNELLSVSDKLISAQITAKDNFGRNALVIAVSERKHGAIDVLAPYYCHWSFLISFFIESFIEKDESGRKTQHGTNLQQIEVFKKIFDKLVTRIIDGIVSARELAVSYLGDLVQQAVESARPVDDVFAAFTNMRNEATNRLADKRAVNQVMEKAMEMFTKKYYGREYVNVYGEDMLALSMSLMEINDPDKETQTKDEFIAEKLSNPLTVAKIERFLVRHEPDDSPRVLDIEQRISEMQSK